VVKEKCRETFLFGETYALSGIRPMTASYNQEDDGEGRKRSSLRSSTGIRHPKQLVINGTAKVKRLYVIRPGEDHRQTKK